MRGREDREERPDDVEEARETRLEPEDELVEIHDSAAHVNVRAEDLRARERAVHDVEVHGDRKDKDEERRQREVRDERPARRRLAEDLFDVGGEGSHIAGRLRVSFLKVKRGIAGGRASRTIHKDVFERVLFRRQFGQQRATGARRVDERIQMLRVAGENAHVPVHALRARSPFKEIRKKLLGKRRGHQLVPFQRIFLLFVSLRQFLHGPHRRDLSLAQHRDAVARHLDLGEEVGVEKDRAPLLGFGLEEVADLAPPDGIDAVRRLVEKKDFGLVHERGRKAEALRHALRELLHLHVHPLGELHAGEERRDARSELRRRHARHPSENGQRLAGREVSGEAMALGQVADAATALRIRDRHSEQRRLTRGGMGETEENLHRGRLPRPIRAEESEQLPRRNAQRDARKSVDFTPADAGGVDLRQIADLDRGTHRRVIRKRDPACSRLLGSPVSMSGKPEPVILTIPVPLGSSAPPAEPGGAKAPVLVVMHGYAMDALPMLGLAKRFAPPSFLIVAIRGPQSAYAVAASTGEYRTGFHFGVSSDAEDNRAGHRASVAAAIAWAGTSGGDTCFASPSPASATPAPSTTGLRSIRQAASRSGPSSESAAGSRASGRTPVYRARRRHGRLPSSTSPRPMTSGTRPRRSRLTGRASRRASPPPSISTSRGATASSAFPAIREFLKAHG